MPKRRVTTAAQRASAKRNLIKARAAKHRGGRPTGKSERAVMRSVKGSSRSHPRSSGDIISHAVKHTPGLKKAGIRGNRKTFSRLVSLGKIKQGRGDEFYQPGARKPSKRKR